MPEQYAVIFQSPDDAWLERIGSKLPGPATQQEWGAMFVGTWEACESFSDTFYNNFQRRGCSMSFYYTVRVSVAAALVGKPHNEVTFGGFVGDDEPAPDAPPDNLHIAATYSGDHYENFALACLENDGAWETAYPWFDSFGQAWAAVEEQRADDPSRHFFVVPHTCAQELHDYTLGLPHDGIYIGEGHFAHWVWEDGMVKVKTHFLVQS